MANLDLHLANRAVVKSSFSFETSLILALHERKSVTMTTSISCIPPYMYVCLTVHVVETLHPAVDASVLPE